jgi:putative transposase
LPPQSKSESLLWDERVSWTSAQDTVAARSAPSAFTKRKYFVTAGTYLKHHRFCGAQRLAVLHRGLLTVTEKFGWQLEAWAVFSNHYHFVAHSPSAEDGARSLPRVLGLLHEKTAKWLNKLDDMPERKVCHNFWDTRLTYEKSYLARLNYTHQNAVKHRLVPVANQYPWCSAAWFERTAALRKSKRFTVSTPTGYERRMIMMWRRSGEVIAQSAVAAYALPAHSILNQRTKHDVNIDVSFSRMPKSAGQSTNDLETQLLPEVNSRPVRRDHEIELHGAKAHSARLSQTMPGHSASDSRSANI